MKNNILIDELLVVSKSCPNVLIGGRWYLAKDEELYSISTILNRIKNAYLVLIGKSGTYHFKQDE